MAASRQRRCRRASTRVVARAIAECNKNPRGGGKAVIEIPSGFRTGAFQESSWASCSFNKTAVRQRSLSARAYHCVLKLSRSITYRTSADSAPLRMSPGDSELSLHLRWHRFRRPPRYVLSIRRRRPLHFPVARPHPLIRNTLCAHLCGLMTNGRVVRRHV